MSNIYQELLKIFPIYPKLHKVFNDIDDSNQLVVAIMSTDEPNTLKRYQPITLLIKIY